MVIATDAISVARTAYPGGPPAFFTEQFGVWINTVSNSALAFNNFLLDALLVSNPLSQAKSLV